MICMHRSLPSIILKESLILSNSRKNWDTGTLTTYFRLFLSISQFYNEEDQTAQIQILSLSVVLMKQLTCTGEILLSGYD